MEMSHLTFLMLFVLPLSLVQIGQCSFVNEEFLRGLERFAESAQKQLGDKPVPDMNHWRLQRTETINTLKELKEKLDSACFYISWANIVDTAMSYFCKLAYLAESLWKYLRTAIYNINISDFMCPAAYFMEMAWSILESVMSLEHKYNLQTIIIKDKEISLILNEWLQSLLELETEAQNIYGFDLKSENSTQFLLLNEFNRLLDHTKNCEEALDLIKRSKYSKFLNVDEYAYDLLQFCMYLKNNPLSAEKIHLSLPILSTLISATKSDFEVHRNLKKEMMYKTILFIWDNLGIKIPLTVKSSNYVSLKLLDIAREVTYIKNTKNIVKDGNCVYSNSLKHIIDILELELTFMETSFFI